MALPEKKMAKKSKKTSGEKKKQGKSKIDRRESKLTGQPKKSPTPGQSSKPNKPLWKGPDQKQPRRKKTKSGTLVTTPIDASPASGHMGARKKYKGETRENPMF